MAAAKWGSILPIDLGQQSFLAPVKQQAILLLPHFDSITDLLSDGQLGKHTGAVPCHLQCLEADSTYWLVTIASSNMAIHILVDIF